MSNFKNPLRIITSILLFVVFPLSFASADEESTLSMDEAFVPGLSLKDEKTIVASWKITNGYYLYKNKFEFTVESGSQVRLGQIDFPEGDIKQDKFFGTQEVYHDQVMLKIPVIASETGDFTIKVKYQGCAEKGVCFPPKRKHFTLTITEAIASASIGTGTQAPEGIQATTAVASQTEESRLTNLLKNGHFLTIVGVFFLGGLALTFTPCVLPMIPILSSIIVGQKKPLKKRECFALSLAYVIGMATTYAVLGVILGVAGNNIIAYLQNPWVISVFAALFVLLSLSMFGLYELQLPHGIQNKLNNLNNRQQGGTHIGTLIMGVLSALIVSPCVSAPLAGALVYISTTQGGALLGGSALFALGMGMGTPLLIIGTGGTHLIPRAGAWMVGVKAFFGVMLLAVAIWFLDRIIPPAFTLALWGALILGSGVFMGGLDFGIKEGWGQFRKTVGFISVLYGCLLWIGAASGASNPLQPLSHIASANKVATTQTEPVTDINSQFVTVSTLEELNAELMAAAERKQPVLLDFFADWCVSCKIMEHEVFPDPSITKRLEPFYLIRADVTDSSTLLHHFKLFGPPSLLFFDDTGKELKKFHIRSEIHAQELAPHLDTVISIAIQVDSNVNEGLAYSH